MLDELIEEDLNNQSKNIVCKICKKPLEKNSIILLCENCFNYEMTNSINMIKNNLDQINTYLAQVNKDLHKLEIQSQKENINIVLAHKLEIDFLNFNSVKMKLEIDKQVNEKAFILNQEQANKIRSIMKWSLFDIMQLNDFYKKGTENEENK